MPKAWKKATPIPQEFNGHGYLYVCTKCGYCTSYFGKGKEPPYKCPNCEINEDLRRLSQENEVCNGNT